MLKKLLIIFILSFAIIPDISFSYELGKQIKIAVVSFKNSVPDERVSAIFKNLILNSLANNPKIKVYSQNTVDELILNFPFEEDNPVKISQIASALDVDFLVTVEVSKIKFFKGDCYIYLSGKAYNNNGTLRTTLEVQGKSEKLNSTYKYNKLSEENIAEALMQASQNFSTYLSNNILTIANVLLINTANNTVLLETSTDINLNVGAKFSVFSDNLEEIAGLEVIKTNKNLSWATIKWIKYKNKIFPNYKAIITYNPYVLKIKKKRILTEKQSKILLTILGVSGTYLYIQNHNRKNK